LGPILLRQTKEEGIKDLERTRMSARKVFCTGGRKKVRNMWQERKYQHLYGPLGLAPPQGELVVKKKKILKKVFF